MAYHDLRFAIEIRVSLNGATPLNSTAKYRRTFIRIELPAHGGLYSIRTNQNVTAVRLQ